jgi:hypothetical protein
MWVFKSQIKTIGVSKSQIGKLPLLRKVCYNLTVFETDLECRRNYHDTVNKAKQTFSIYSIYTIGQYCIIDAIMNRSIIETGEIGEEYVQYFSRSPIYCCIALLCIITATLESYRKINYQNYSFYRQDRRRNFLLHMTFSLCIQGTKNTITFNGQGGG